MGTIYLGVFLLSAAGLAFEVTLTRVFALAHLRWRNGTTLPS
jgi:hypothetical protein